MARYVLSGTFAGQRLGGRRHGVDVEAVKLLCGRRGGFGQIRGRFGTTKSVGLGGQTTNLVGIVQGVLRAEAERRAVNEALAPQFGTAKKTKTSLKSAKRLKKLPADFDGLAVAERWTDLVSSTPYGRAQWAYVMGLASSRAFVDANPRAEAHVRL